MLRRASEVIKQSPFPEDVVVHSYKAMAKMLKWHSAIFVGLGLTMKTWSYFFVIPCCPGGNDLPLLLSYKPEGFRYRCMWILSGTESRIKRMTTTHCHLFYYSKFQMIWVETCLSEVLTFPTVTFAMLAPTNLHAITQELAKYLQFLRSLESVVSSHTKP